MHLIRISILLLLVKAVRTESCNSPITDLITEEVVNADKVCATTGSKLCLMKCCRKNEVLYKKLGVPMPTCKSIEELRKEINLTDILNYGNITFGRKYEYSSKDFRLLYSNFVDSPSCARMPNFPIQVTVNETVRIDGNFPSANALDFCLDHRVGMRNGEVVHDTYYILKLDDGTSDRRKAMLTTWGISISAFFLLLTLAVYWKLKHLRKLMHIKLKMGCIGTLMVYYVYQAWFSIHMYKALDAGEDLYKLCPWISPIAYFMLLSSFMWLNALGFDLWIKFSKSRDPHRYNHSPTIKRRATRKKLLKYCLFCLGVPLAMTTAALLIEHYGGKDVVKPGFPTCRVNNNNKLIYLYLYVPIGAVMLGNMLMFCKLVCLLCSPALKAVRKNQKETNQLKVFSQLFLTMGVTWILELAVPWHGEMPEWLTYVLDLPNVLQGLVIFLQTILTNKLYRRLLSSMGVGKWSRDDNRSTFATNTSVAESRTLSKQKSATLPS